VAATGTDIIDKAYCKEHGITIVNIRNYAFNTVPEHVLALIFALRRNLFALRRRTPGMECGTSRASSVS
jgi:glycerate dehydrogenase